VSGEKMSSLDDNFGSDVFSRSNESDVGWKQEFRILRDAFFLLKPNEICFKPGLALDFSVFRLTDQGMVAVFGSDESALEDEDEEMAFHELHEPFCVYAEASSLRKFIKLVFFVF